MNVPPFLTSAVVLLCVLPVGCNRLVSPSRAAPAKKWVKWNAEDFFADTRAISLCKAIEAHNLGEIERLVKSGVDVNIKGRGNMTPLLWAFPVGEDVFRKLLELRADPNVRLTEKAWPLLFEKGKSVMSACAFPLVIEPGPMHKCYFGDVPMENYLGLAIKHGGNPNIQDDEGDTPLFELRRSIPGKARERIRMLIDAGADVNHRNHRGWTPLIAAGETEADYALALLAVGADYRLVDNRGGDFILWLENAKRILEGERRERPGNSSTLIRLNAMQPVRDWLTKEGVRWQAARAALESPETMKNLKNLPADYQHRPWLPQRPTLKKPDAKPEKRP
jgi:hypothetical protein